MPLEAKKGERENSQTLVRRFTKRVKKSRILMQARRARFRRRQKSRQMKKRAALRREEKKKEYEKQKKLGGFKE